MFERCGIICKFAWRSGKYYFYCKEKTGSKIEMDRGPKTIQTGRCLFSMFEQWQWLYLNCMLPYYSIHYGQFSWRDDFPSLFSQHCERLRMATPNSLVFNVDLIIKLFYQLWRIHDEWTQKFMSCYFVNIYLILIRFDWKKKNSAYEMWARSHKRQIAKLFHFERKFFQ